jgi:hypothetical protein
MHKVSLWRSKARDKQNAEVHAEVALWLGQVLATTGTEHVAAAALQEGSAPATADVG